GGGSLPVTIPNNNPAPFPAVFGPFMPRLPALADRPRSPTGTTPEDRADRQRAVAFASPERSELGINDEVGAPSAWADVLTFHLDHSAGLINTASGRKGRQLQSFGDHVLIRC